MAQAPMFGRQLEPPNLLDFNAGLFSDNPMLAMAGNWGMAKAMGAAGLVPAQFAPTQNFADQFFAKQFHLERQAAMGMGAAADRDTYVNLLRGIARMNGRPFTLRQEQAAQSLAGGIAQVAPFLAQMMPETFDAMHGSHGSAQVMGLGLHRGGQLAQDAATGLTGVSGATAGTIAAEIRGRFFGPGGDVSAFKGLSQGRLGMLYEDLQQRGAMGSSIAALSPARQLDAASGGDPARRAALEKIQRDTPDEWDNIKRTFDARKVGDRLQNLAGAVSAMRDIFGDMGRPNAPMRALVEGLEQLTQGGLATMAPGQLEKSVRMTQALARSTGIGMEGTMALMARGAGITDSLGIERVFGIQATQGAMAFGAAFGQSGAGAAAHFQAGSREDMMLLDQRLRAQAANSGMANQLNTALRIGTTLGLGGGAANLVDAIKKGQTAFDDLAGNKAASVFMDEGAFRSLMMAGGADEATLLRMGSQANTNRQYGAKYDTAALVRQAQGRDLRAFYTQAQRGGIAGFLERHGITGDRAAQLAAEAGAAGADALFGMEATDRHSDAKRNQAVGGAIKAKLAASVAISADEAAALSEGGWGDFNEMIHRDPRTRGYGTGLRAVDSADDRILGRQREVTEENRITAAMRSSMAAIGQAGPLARLSDVTQTGAAGLSDFIGKVLGGQTPDAIRKALDAAKGDLKGLADPDRLALMSEQMARTMQGFEAAKRIANPAERNKALGAMEGDSAALIAGGDVAKAQLGAALKDAGLAESDLGAALMGQKGNFNAVQRQRLQALAVAASGKGIPGTAEATGMAAGATFGRAQVDEILGASGRLAAGRSRLGGLTGEARAAALREVERHGGTFASGVTEGVGALLGSDKTIHALGAGGLKLVQGLRDAQLKLQHLADKKSGGDVGKLLASGDPEAEALRQQIGAGMDDVARRQDTSAGAKAATAMTDAEKKEATEYQKAQAAPDADQNKAAIEKLLKETGGKLGDEEVAALAGGLGEGERGAVSRAALERGLKARSGLDALAKKHGWDAASFRGIIGRGEKAKGLDAAEQAEAARLGGEAGSLLRADEGKSLKIYQDALEGVKAKGAAAGDDDGKGGGGAGPMKISGQVTITNGNLLTFTDAKAAPAGRGSTPVGRMPA